MCTRYFMCIHTFRFRDILRILKRKEIWNSKYCIMFFVQSHAVPFPVKCSVEMGLKKTKTVAPSAGAKS